MQWNEGKKKLHSSVLYLEKGVATHVQGGRMAQEHGPMGQRNLT